VKTMMLWLLWLLLSLLTTGNLTLKQREKEGEELQGDNICHTEVLESVLVNTSYLESVRIKKHFACLRIPPVCAEWVPSMETRWREENITRTVTRQDCCPGYKRKGQGRGRQKICAPWCSEGCANGKCTRPETCTCRSGFSGDRCEVPGCPGGRWGPDCGTECMCEHGGHCRPHDGTCECTPGYRGEMCSETCDTGTYGMGCQSSCSCPTGHRCHPVTGDCTPCTRGHWGDNCQEECRCDTEGTELCSHQDGKCFCKGNRFGPYCELSCPFGYINSTCLQEPREETCRCPNDLYTCDIILGCVCPPNTDCGLEILDRTVVLSPLSSESPSTNSFATPVILCVLVIALTIIILVVLYYRRRMKVMKADLASRTEPSVYYSDPERERDLGPDPRQTHTHTHTHTPSTGLVLNNVRLNLDSQTLRPQPGAASVPGMVKNINVDNFKLGMGSSVVVPPQSCMDRMMEEMEEDVEEEEEHLTEQQATDVNLFLEDLGKGKVGKADLERMIRNNLKQGNSTRREEGTGAGCHTPRDQGQGAACQPRRENGEPEDPFADFESKLNVVLPDKNTI